MAPRYVRFFFKFIFLLNFTDVFGVDLPQLSAILSQEAVSTRDETGTLVLTAGINQRIVLVGSNFANTSRIAFTTDVRLQRETCDGQRSQTFAILSIAQNGTLATVVVNLPLPENGKYYHVCYSMEGVEKWEHGGKETLTRFAVKDKETTLLPLWLQIIFICFLLILSGLFSGLNLGLMALDKTELKLIAKCGSSSEKKYAKAIEPVRKRGNFLLCTLLLGNVLVNNSLTILLDDLSNGLYAVIGATLGIVICGEIIPQAICSRHGLAVGARTIWITRLFMLLTFPLSFPISLLLDKILGEEIGNVYDRAKLSELVKVTKEFNDLKNDEVNIISGALDLSKKSVTEVMTKIEDVFMLDINSILDFETVSEIMKRGYTRIPIYEGEQGNIVALLNIKDLALIDPDDRTPIRTVIKFYQHPLIFVFDDQKLDTMLQEFRQGHSHMAIVRRVNNEGDGDPYYETLGVLTLEDVIEEIIQSEIIDETDIIIDNRKKTRRTLAKQDFSMFNTSETTSILISPQLALAAFRFLSTSVDLFKEEFVSENVLKKLIRQNVVEEIVKKENSDQYLFRENVPCDYFILILQGNVEVTVGKEGLRFFTGPFSYYGSQALKITDNSLIYPSSTESLYSKLEPYIPDFSVRVESNLLFVRVRRAEYIAARRATMMGKTNVKSEDEAFAKEWHKAKILSNLSNNDNHHLNGSRNPDKMRRASSLSVPFTNQIQTRTDSGEWRVHNSTDGGIVIHNMSGDHGKIETRERSATEPNENDLAHQCLEPKVSSGDSGDSIGWEDAKSDNEGHPEQHEHTPLITTTCKTGDKDQESS
ncbi:metal transporter CNNM4-like [Saccostrea cucullata]|uniref:metal transporter CNNM4-like n=1 Tax=Saccostrea cuccullata TaxID=36930 RepID=UPI002ED56370